MKDNVGNEIHLGDDVYCYSGKYKNQIRQVQGFRTITDEILGEVEAVNLSSRDWLTAVNVVSLNALGITEIPQTEEPPKRSDILGNPLRIGDKVLFLHRMEMYAEIGTVKSMTDKSCLLAIKQNRFGQAEYRKKYEELISLTAIGKEDLVPQHDDFSC